MADADTIYRVLAVYDAETKAAEHNVGGLAIVLDHMVNLLERAGHLLHHVWELDTAAESAQIAMAGLMNASRFPGADDMNMSMVMSSQLMNTMRTDAAALSGTYEQMQTIFQATIPVAKEAAQSLMSAEKLSGKVMEFGNTFNIPAEFIGGEFRRLMEGQASNRNALFRDLSSFMGHIDPKDFNALTSPEKWQKVTDALEHFDPMFKRIGDTGKAQLSTFESYWNQLVRIGTGGVFEGLKHELKEVNDWYTKHQAMVDDMAKKLGKDLGEGLMQTFTIAKDAIAFIVSHREAIKDIAEAFLVFKGFSMLGGGMGMAGSLAGGSSKLELGNVLGGGAFGMALAHATGSTNLFQTSLMTAEGAMATLPGPIGLVAKALLVFHAALQFGVDKFKKATDEKFEKEDKLLSLVDNVVKNRDVGALFSRAREMGAIDKNTMDFNAVKFKDALIKEGATPDLALATTRTAILELQRMDHYERAKRMGLVPGIEAETDEMKARRMLEMQTKAVAHKGDTNVYLHVEQTLHDADDPDRVYISTKNAVRDALQRRSTSARGLVLR